MGTDRTNIIQDSTCSTHHPSDCSPDFIYCSSCIIHRVTGTETNALNFGQILHDRNKLQLYHKKNSTCEGQAAPPGINVRRRPLTQAEKTPEPLPHPYTGAL